MLTVRVPRKNIPMDILANLVFAGCICYGFARMYSPLPTDYFVVLKYAILIVCLISLAARKTNIYKYRSANAPVRWMKRLSIVREALSIPLMASVYLIIFPPFFPVSQLVEAYLFLGGLVGLLVVLAALYILDKKTGALVAEIEAYRSGD